MIAIEVNAQDVTARLSRIPVTMRERVKVALVTAGATVQRATAANIGPGQVVGVRTGTMQRSLFTSGVTETGDGTEIHVGYDLSKAPYARMQEMGGTVYPRNAAHLTIPLPAMLTANGVARGTARDVIASPQAFGYASTFTRNDVIFGVLGKTSTGRTRTRTMKDTGEVRTSVPLFALKSSVELKARPALRDGLASSRDVILGLLQKAVGEGLNG